MKTLFASIGIMLLLGWISACGSGESILIAVSSSARVVDAQGDGVDGVGVRFDIYKNEDLKVHLSTHDRWEWLCKPECQRQF